MAAFKQAGPKQDDLDRAVCVIVGSVLPCCWCLGRLGGVGSPTALSRVEQSVFERLPCVLEGYLRPSAEIVDDPFVGWLVFLKNGRGSPQSELLAS